MNTSWQASKRPGKQRKYRANAGLHLRKKFIVSTLSKELRKKYGKRNVPIRKGDVVKIMRGKFRKKTGKVIRVDIKRLIAEVEGIQIKKQDGSKVNVRFNPSVLQITQLNTDDKKRNIPKKELNQKTETGENKNAPQKTGSS